MRAWNFCAGPAAIPEEVLREAQEELLEWNDAKSSVMEVSHRSDFFQEVATESKKDFIDEITSKTSESESAGCTGKLNTSLTKISALGQLDWYSFIEG